MLISLYDVLLFLQMCFHCVLMQFEEYRIYCELSKGLHQFAGYTLHKVIGSLSLSHNMMVFRGS